MTTTMTNRNTEWTSVPYLRLLHGSTLKNLPDDFVILVGAKLVFQGRVGRRVEDTLSALSVVR